MDVLLSGDADTSYERISENVKAHIRVYLKTFIHGRIFSKI